MHIPTPRASLRTEPIRKGAHLNSTTGHNHRTDPNQSTNIDRSRTHLNEHLIKTAESIPEAVYSRVKQAGVSIPKTAEVHAQELSLSASSQYFRPDYHPDDPDGWGKYDQERMEKWRDATMEWLEERFGKENIVDAVLHLDERTPHIQAIVVPITEVDLKKRRTKQQIKDGVEAETYRKKRWNRTKVFGIKQHYEMQDGYAEAIKHLGIERGVSNKLTDKQHVDYKDYHKKQHQLVHQKIKYPDTSSIVDTDLAFKLPKAKAFESAKNYIKRCEQAILQVVEETIADDFRFKLDEVNRAIEKSKEFTEALAKEAKQQKEKNDILTDIITSVEKEVGGAELINNLKMIHDISKKLDKEAKLESDKVKTEKNTTPKPAKKSLSKKYKKNSFSPHQ